MSNESSRTLAIARILICIFSLALSLAGIRAADDSVVLAAVGDVMLARSVPAQIASHDPMWPWEALAGQMKDADLRFCNLECPVSTGGLQIPKRYSFRADPLQAAQVLHAGGIDVVSLANNHSYDYSRSGLRDTVNFLATEKITALGTGIGHAGAVQPQFLTRNGLKFAFVAYTEWTPDGYIPLDDALSLAVVDEATFSAELRAAKQDADFLVVSMHWGAEYSRGFTDSQQRLAHQAIDAGADLIIGHHPHVAQTVEVYRDRPILYSLGNCIFDRTGPYHSNGALARVRFSKTAVEVEKLLPFNIEEARPTLFPRPDDVFVCRKKMWGR